MFSGKKGNFDIALARKVRKLRSLAKKDLKEGKVTLEKFLEAGNPLGGYLGNLKVSDIISSLPGYGPVKTDAVLKKLKISTCKKINGLGKKQKLSIEKYFNVKLLNKGT